MRVSDRNHLWALLRLIAFAAALLIAPGASNAQPPHDLATGTGTLGTFGNPTMHVNASILPNGRTNGSFSITYPDGTFASGRIVCLFVQGNTAFLIGQTTSVGGPADHLAALNWAVGNFIDLGVQDNGEPGTGPVPDRMNFSPGHLTEPTCGVLSDADPDQDNNLFIVKGNFQVVDAP